MSKKNYQNFARYIRTKIDGKKLFVTEPEKPSKTLADAFFYIGEDNYFANIKDFENYLKKQKIYQEGKPKVALIAGIHDPFSGNRQHLDSIIVSLQKSGLNVYPFATFNKRIDFLEQINPDAVVYFSHGRVQMMEPDDTVEWLKKTKYSALCTTFYLGFERQMEGKSNGDVRWIYGANYRNA